MIPFSTAFAFVIAAVFTVLLPIVILIILGIRRKMSGLPLLFGAVAFFLSQIVLRIPLMNILSRQSWYQAFAANLILYVFVAALSAALFEESARLGGALILKKHRSYKDMISFGLGHGLCEVILLVGLSYVNNAILCLTINSGGEVPVLPAEALEMVTAQLRAINPMDIFWGVLERFSAVVLHIFATVLVFKGIANKKIRYYFLAILTHTLMNFTGVMVAQFAGIVVSEIVLLIAALIMGFYLIKNKSDEPLNEASKITG